MSKPMSVEQFRTSNVDSVKVIQAVEVQSIFGDGLIGKDSNSNEYSPIRRITEYFDLKGNLLATVDNYKKETK